MIPRTKSASGSDMLKLVFGICALCLALFALAACSGGSGDGGEGPSDTTDGDQDSAETDTETGDSDALIGTFVVSLTAPVEATDSTTETAGKANLTGVVNDGPSPVATIFEVFQTSGACTLLKPRIPFCETACENGAVCVEDNTCLAYPTALSLGTLSVTGLTLATGASSFTLTPINGNYQTAGATKLAYPPFAEGDAVSLSLPGNDTFAALTLSGKGIGQLALTGSAYDLKKDTDFVLAWTKAGSAANSKIHVKLDISHHGGTKGKIECDTDDNGALTIDKSLVTTLLNLGVAGFPSVIVTRQSIGETSTRLGRVQLDISATVEHQVTVEGLTSCNADEDCPDGQTCQDNLTCS